MEPWTIAGMVVPPGTVQHSEVALGNLPTGAPLPVPVIAAHGVQPGPRLFLTGCLHGDEIIGIEIIRTVLEDIDPKQLRGSIVAVPIVNVFGFVQGSRYLPDRRDLNRSFPGSATGSLAAQLAHVFLTEIMEPCTHGIDLHTGSDDRTNYPHIRGNLDDADTLAMARAFGSRLIVHANTRDGSLRLAASKRNITCLVYEAGETHRFDKEAIEVGRAGVANVLRFLGMVGNGPHHEQDVHVVRATKWLRARRAGILRLEVELGQSVEPGEQLGVIRNGAGTVLSRLRATQAGVVLGLSLAPLVHRGDGVLHLALTNGG